MTRDDFTAGLTQRLRNVLQKHERESAIRRSAGLEGRRLAEANTNLDAVLLELGEFVFDALDELNTRLDGKADKPWQASI